MATSKVRKAVIAAAGFGTRFLPQTKAMPKEMLPLIDKPIIQYIVEELVEAGIQDIVIVTGYHKRSIEDHFDAMSADLTANLQQAGKEDLLAKTKQISQLANFAYVRQKGPYGSGTPVRNVEHLVGDEPFIYTYADDFIAAKPSRFKQMISLYEKKGCPVLPCIRLTKDEDYDRYGVIAGKEITRSLIDMTTIIEKPGKKNAPSDLASVNGYLLTPEIFQYLAAIESSLKPGQEFYIQLAMQAMLNDGKKLYALEIQNGHFYDTGNKLEYLKTLVDFALQHPDVKEGFKDYLRDISLH